MRKSGYAFLFIALALAAGVLSGCDNRSQFEKDVDKAAANVKSTFK